MPRPPVINRRALLKGLIVGGGAALWAACSPRKFAPAGTPYPTATRYPTETPYPTPSPTPDLSPAIDKARPWFAIDEVLRTIPLKPGGPAQAAIIARVGGRERAVALKVDQNWVVNIPRLDSGLESLHSTPELNSALHELSAQGYGYDLLLTGTQAGKQGLIGVPSTPDILRSNCYSDLFESPAGSQAQVRWLGNDWVGGFTNGSGWGAAVPPKFDGTEKFFTGNFLLTCDDCHDEQDTRFILSYAEAMGAKVTFFPNTPYVKMFPQMWKDIVKAGHEIGFHTTTHSNGEWTPAYLESDCSYFETTFRTVTGLADYHVVTARPPFGLWYKGGWQDWVESRGLVTAMWSRTIGWDSSPQVLRRTITENGGLILLSHANPLNVQWFKDNDGLIKELAPKYHWPTITEVLLKDWTPVNVIGLPVDSINKG